MKNGLIIDKLGIKYWYEDDQLHRIDSPACKYANSNKCWYIEGKHHRIDGPAVEYINGSKVWYYQGRYSDCQTQQQFEKLIKLRLFW